MNITEHIEGDSCKLAVWTGRAPLSDHRIVMKSASMDVKQLWVKRIRELIQEKYLYMEAAMCEAGNRSNRNSKDFDLDAGANADFINGNGSSTGSNMLINSNANTTTNTSTVGDNYSSAASNASSGNKVSTSAFPTHPLPSLGPIKTMTPLMRAWRSCTSSDVLYYFNVSCVNFVQNSFETKFEFDYFNST